MNGMTLEDCEYLNIRLAAYHEGQLQITVNVTFAQDSTKEEFLLQARTALSQRNCVICINFNPTSLIGKEFCGHFSPLAAYHEASRKFLILDVWEETPAMWVDEDDLWDTINTKDWDSKLSRGWMILQQV